MIQAKSGELRCRNAKKKIYYFVTFFFFLVFRSSAHRLRFSRVHLEDGIEHRLFLFVPRTCSYKSAWSPVSHDSTRVSHFISRTLVGNPMGYRTEKPIGDKESFCREILGPIPAWIYHIHRYYFFFLSYRFVNKSSPRKDGTLQAWEAITKG